MAYNAQCFDEDVMIAKSLINRDEMTTKKYYYERCYPLFKSVYDNYYTDCESCKEFMDEIYMLVLTPSKITGKCQMANYKGDSSLASWLKSVCLYYCYHKYGLSRRSPELIPFSSKSRTINHYEETSSDSYESLYGSIDIDMSQVDRDDIKALIAMMPNFRYRKLMQLLYLEHKSHKETAEALGMTMDNYYNKRILAEKQFKQIYWKEADNV